MSNETDALFQAMFALEDAREVLRQTAPGHKLNDQDRKAMATALEKAKAAIAMLEGIL